MKRTAKFSQRLKLLKCLLAIWALFFVADFAPAQSVSPGAVLILYDSSGSFGWLGDIYAKMLANLMGHFQLPYQITPVESYTSNDVNVARATFYIGTVYANTLPTTFLTDVIHTTNTVCWFKYNIWEIDWDGRYSPTFESRYGISFFGLDETGYSNIVYKSTTLTKNQADPELGYIGIINSSIATNYATACTDPGTCISYITKGSNFWYIADNPFSFTSQTDRYLAFCDVLHDILGIYHPEEHQAFIRLHSNFDTNALYQYANYLRSNNVPYGITVTPQYKDPFGTYNSGTPVDWHLTNSALVDYVGAIQYMATNGGQVVALGYTHQYDTTNNPYTGVTWDDFEYWREMFQGNTNESIFQLYGPIPEDSDSWVQSRLVAVTNELAEVNLKAAMWMTPFYYASTLDYQNIATNFPLVTGQALYFSDDYTPANNHLGDQFFPYVIYKDVYGQCIFPENIGNILPSPYFSPPVTATDLVNLATINLVVRDGVASGYMSVYYDLTNLEQLVSGIQGAGYTYVMPGPPLITSQVQSQTVTNGSSATFSVTNQGSPPLHYQWYFNSTPLANATNSSLTVNNAWGVNAGNYSVVITNSFSSVTGSVATLSVVLAPTVTSGLKLWLAADHGITNAPSTSINYWPDQSGNGNNATHSGSGSPEYLTNVINGYPAVQFTSSFGMGLPNFLTGTTGAEAYAVVKSTAVYSSLWVMGGAGTVYPYGDGTIREAFGSTISQNLGLSAQPLSQYNLYNVAGENGNWSAWLNGVLQYGTTNNTYDYSTSPILGYATGASSLSGDIAEVLVYNRVLSTAERQAVSAYLDMKYNLAPAEPAAITNLTATAISQTQVGLTWAGLWNQGVTTVTIERSTNSSSDFAVVGQVQNASSYVDTNLAAGTTYYYLVQVSNGGPISGYSNEAEVTTASSGSEMPLSSLLLWLKADTGLTATISNAVVNCWPDQSSQENHATQGSSTGEPVLVTNALNGFPVVQFTSSYGLGLPTNMFAGTTGGEAYVVLKSTAAYSDLWAMGGGLAVYPYGDGTIRDAFGSTAEWVFGPPVQSLGQYHLYNVASQTGEWSAWINGLLQFSTNGNTYAYTTSPILGYGGNGNSAFSGDIAEVLIFNRPLTAGERDSVSSYLFSKYGLLDFATNVVVPSTPTNFASAGIAPYQLSLQWMPTSANAYSFHVQRASGTNGTFEDIDQAPTYASNVVDTTANPTNVYTYRVKAHNLFGDSAYSTVISPPTIGLTNWSSSISETASNSITAVAASVYGTVSNVTFHASQGLAEPVSTSPYTISLSPLMEGTWTVSALAQDSLGNSQFSAAATISVYMCSNTNGIPDVDLVGSGNNPVNPWIPPAFNPSDHTPPTINLFIPTNAVLVP